jgi:putative endopeptidase
MMKAVLLRRAVVAFAVIGVAAATALDRPSSGLDPSGFDRGVRAQDDLFRYVNGRWLDQTVIPPDRVSFGAFTEIADRTEADLRAIIEELAARRNRRTGTIEQQVGDLYASVMDQAAIDHAGASPITPELRKIDAIVTTRELAAEAGYLSSIAAGGPFDGVVGTDSETPGALVVRVMQGGTLLPDRDYYLSPDPIYAGLRGRYTDYLTHIFTLIDRSDPAKDARAVLVLETELAGAQWSQADSRNLATTNTRFTLPQLATEMPGFDWRAWAQPQGLDRSPRIILAQPSFFRQFAELVRTRPLESWKAWLIARYVTASAPYLSAAFDGARFEFFGRILTGQEAPRVRWKRGVSLVNAYLGDAVGRLYVEQHIAPSVKVRLQKLVGTIVRAYRGAIQESDWLSGSAKNEALKKLARLKTKVGYPEEWRNYNGLVIKPDDLFGNVQRALKFDNDYRVRRVVGVAETGQWALPPQTVNAYYAPAANEIVLPAAMLQPPLFDVNADEAVNYGAIGAIIGHEIGHAFDRRGRYYDARGAVRDWWTVGDERRFDERARRLAAQFDAYVPLPGLHVNGTLTLEENAGDLAGLTMAYRAYRIALDGKPSPTIDGLTGEQRLFMGWAQIWRAIERDDYSRQQLLSDPYAPPRYRTNGTVSNVAGFYAAFDVKAGDRLYCEPERRVTIW